MMQDPRPAVLAGCVRLISARTAITGKASNNAQEMTCQPPRRRESVALSA